MNKPILALCAAALLAVPMLAADRRDPREGHGYANPSAVIAAEIGFARLAQEKGQWTAFRTTATKDAVMFTPQPVYAQLFLKGKADPAKAVAWQPHQVWSSCDGTMAITRGAWQAPDGTSGYFTTVWQRQKDGKYKWTLDQGDPLPMPLDAPEMIVAKVADCPAGYRADRASKPRDFKGKLPALDPAHLAGRSHDGTLGWDVTVAPTGARRFVVTMTSEGKPATVQDIQTEAPAK
ncbi:MAG: hypothetical protein ABL914_01235 [Novosphingobium sp.]|uniref:hypothetical protein n=1 Tax=Novosphingobium sp. TaxID=1874826 RepID=UPI0032BCFED6